MYAAHCAICHQLGGSGSEVGPPLDAEALADGRSFPPEDKLVRTYYVGENSTGWTSNRLAGRVPDEGQTFTIDLWRGNGDFKLTGIALTVMGGKAAPDRIELLCADGGNGSSPSRAE